MFRIFKFTILSVCIGLVGLGMLPAQSPKQEKGKQSGGEKRKETRPEPKPDPTVEAWVKTLADKMTDRHDTVRNSSRAALVAIGRPAIPALAKLAESQDSAIATAAKSVMAKINSQGRGPHGPSPFGKFGPKQFDFRKGGFRGFSPNSKSRSPFPGMKPGPGFPGKGDFNKKGGEPGRGPKGPFPGTGKGGPERKQDKAAPGFPQRPGKDAKGDGNAKRSQGSSRGPGFGGPLSDRFAKELNLTDKQKESLKTAGEENRKKVGELMEKMRKDNSRPDFSKVREAMRPVQEEMKKKVDAILTPDQKKKLEELQKAGRGPGQPGSRPGGPERRGGSNKR